MRAVVRWSVDNPVAVNLLFLLIVGAGLAAFVSMPREVMPAINLDQVRIETTYPGGTAEEVERLVTARIEEAIENVPGVGETRSLSRPGFSEVTVEVSFGEDVDTVARRIEVEWESETDAPRRIRMRVRSEDTPGLLASIR